MIKGMYKVKLLTILIVISVSTENLSVFAQQIPVKEDNSIRLMSYVIQSEFASDSVVDYYTITNNINHVKPDVVGIQMIVNFAKGDSSLDMIDFISRETLMYPTYITSIDTEVGEHKLLVLAKEKPLSTRTVELSESDEPITLMIVEFEKFYFGNTYVSYVGDERLMFEEIIKKEIEKLDKPFFLTGGMDYSYKKHKCWSLLLDRGFITDTAELNIEPKYADIRIHRDIDDIFRTKPYLQNPTDNGITISWLTNVQVHSWVEYGINGALDQKKQIYIDGQMLINNFQHKFRLEDLIPGETYSYRVCSREVAVYEAYIKEFGKTVMSDVYTFRLPTKHDIDFKAIIFNDLHQNRTLIDLFGNLIEDIDYDFIMFNGDNIDDPKNEAQAVSSLAYMNEKVKAESFPVFYIRGNHEIRNAYSIGLRDLLDYVGGKTYGAFNWGDTRFVMLDCGEDKDDNHIEYSGLNDFSGLRKDQAFFLKDEIKSEDFLKATKRVLIHHIPLYGLRENAYNPSLEEWGNILNTAQFDISLHGHTHKFAFHPIGSLDNNYPVVIGGGSNTESATIMILEKHDEDMTLIVLNVSGDELLRFKL